MFNVGATEYRILLKPEVTAVLVGTRKARMT
jgi:hypothetical protein